MKEVYEARSKMAGGPLRKGEGYWKRNNIVCVDVERIVCFVCSKVECGNSI